MRIHSADVLSKMLMRCEKEGIVTIADEVMTGFGRTGPLFATSVLGTSPDLLCLSKGITGGFLPMGATLSKREVFESFLSPDPRQPPIHPSLSSVPDTRSGASPPSPLSFPGHPDPLRDLEVINFLRLVSL